MKKIAKIALALAVLVGFSACGAKNNDTKEAGKESKTEQAKTDKDGKYSFINIYQTVCPIFRS